MVKYKFHDMGITRTTMNEDGNIVEYIIFPDFDHSPEKPKRDKEYKDIIKARDHGDIEILPKD